MGLFDFLIPKKDPADRCARRIALETGLLQECPVCRGITDARAGQAAWDKAEAQAAKADRSECGDSADLLSRIHRQVDQAGLDCRCDLGAD